MNTTQRYGKPQSVLTIGNKPRNTALSHFSPNPVRINSDGRVNSLCPRERGNFSRSNVTPANARGNYRRPFRQWNYQANGWPRNSHYDRSQSHHRFYPGYVCYFHQRFKQAAYRCEGPNCNFSLSLPNRFFILRRPAGPIAALDCRRPGNHADYYELLTLIIAFFFNRYRLDCFCH